MLSDLESEKYGRGMRQTRRSLRAKQAAGLDDDSIKQLSRPSNGTTDPSILSRSSSVSTQPYPDTLTSANMSAGKTPASSKAFPVADRRKDTQSPSNVLLIERAASIMEAQNSELHPRRGVPPLVTNFATTSQTKQLPVDSPVDESQSRTTPARPMDSAQSSPSKPATKPKSRNQATRRPPSKLEPYHNSNSGRRQ